MRDHRGLSPSEQQRILTAEFPGVVSQSSFHLWRPGDPVLAEGIRILVGVLPWTRLDMRLLDVIAEGMPQEETKAPVVDLFNTADCRDQQAFSQYIPNLPSVAPQTPVVGIWRNGWLEWFGQGYVARDRIADVRLDCRCHRQ